MKEEIAKLVVRGYIQGGSDLLLSMLEKLKNNNRNFISSYELELILQDWHNKYLDELLKKYFGDL